MASEDGPPGADREAERTAAQTERLESMLATYRNQEDKDPFLSAWCSSTHWLWLSRVSEQLLPEYYSGCHLSNLYACRPKGIADTDEAEVLSGGMFQHREIQNAWSPFTQPLGEAGLPRKTFRAPLLSKLSDAGFSNVLDVSSLCACH